MTNVMKKLENLRDYVWDSAEYGLPILFGVVCFVFIIGKILQA